MADDPIQNIPKILSGLKGAADWNDPMKAARLSPGLTFRDAVPADVRKAMNMATPSKGPMVDNWAQRKRGGK